MFDAYTMLTEKGCASTPQLLQVKQEKQEPTDMVPGGQVVYLLVEKLPGKQLGSEFWELYQDKRDAIRRAFKTAWELVITLSKPPILVPCY